MRRSWRVISAQDGADPIVWSRHWFRWTAEISQRMIAAVREVSEMPELLPEPVIEKDADR